MTTQARVVNECGGTIGTIDPVALRQQYGVLMELYNDATPEQQALLDGLLELCDTVAREMLGPPATYAIKANDGGFLAVQGETHWFEDTPKGWALFTTEDGARNAAEHHHSATGGFEIVKVEEEAVE